MTLRAPTIAILSGLLLTLAPTAEAQIGGIEGALKCGTIGGVGLNRCEDDPTPTSGVSCEDGGSADGLGGIEQAIGDGLRAAGFDPRADSVYVFRRSGGLICFQIRLGTQGQALPSLSCIAGHLEAGDDIEPGSLQGTRTVIIGCIQQAGGRTRVTSREVDIETGVIGETGKGDAAGTDSDAIRDAAESAFEDLAGEDVS